MPREDFSRSSAAARLPKEESGFTGIPVESTVCSRQGLPRRRRLGERGRLGGLANTHPMQAPGVSPGFRA